MRQLLSWYLAGGLAVAALGALIAPSSTWSSLATVIAGFAAVGAIICGLRLHRPSEPRFWQLLAVALGLGGFAASLFLVMAITASSSAYHLGDLLYAPGYLMLTVSAIVLLRRFGPLRVAGLDAAIGALVLSSFLWSLVIEPNVVGVGGFKGISASVFPLCDVAVLMLILRVLFSPLARLPSVRLLAAASITLVVSDVLYFSPVVANGVSAGRAINALYVIAYVLFGASALHPSMHQVPARATFTEGAAPRRLILVLAFAVLTTPLAIVFTNAIEGVPDPMPLGIIGATTVALVIVRIMRLLRHLDSLRLRAEASEQLFRMVFDSAGHGMSIGANGMMTETNPALQRMLGYTEAELSGQHYTETTHPDDRALSLEASNDVMSGRTPSHTFEKRLVRKDGSIVWVDVTLTRARDGSFGISLVDDITVRKGLEEELRQAQKMEAVGKLAGGIAHDFNNVMTAVSGCADLLADEMGMEDPRRQRVEVIQQSAARATDLTRQLLAFSRRQVLRFEPVDLAQVAVGVRPILGQLLPPNIDVTYDLAESAVVRADRPQLEQVLLNLALNARDAMPNGGKLGIRVRALGEIAELSVIDSGEGMDDATKARIFEPFFTTKHTGTGLGLSMVDGVVGQSGGTLSVDTAPGKGSSFTISLPRIDEPAVERAPAPERPLSRNAGRVLLADDDDLVRGVTTEMLRRSGYDVVAAASGEEALGLLDTGDHFDVLVTDVAMAGIDGQELARRARELDQSLPVLFVSGYAAEVLSGDWMVDDGDEVLTKPFTSAELAERVELVRRRAAELLPA